MNPIVRPFAVLAATTLLAGVAAAQSAPAAGVPSAPEPAPGLSLKKVVQSFNPDVSAVLDGFYYYEDSAEGLGHVMEELSGFGHAHGEGEDAHGHDHGIDNGFNLRHIELIVSASVDPYFRALVNAAVDEHGAELEEAWFETIALPGGLKLKAGKFYSDFGYINAQHAHQWDFTDQPLIYRLLLGDHGLNDKGAQLSWLAPTPFYLVAGIEGFQGDNEASYAYHGEEPLPERDAPRVAVGWLKFGPDLPGCHGLQFGVFGITGAHQEEYDGDEDGTHDQWLDGDSTIWGADFIYRYDAPKPYAQGDLTVQGEYASRTKSLDLVADDLAPEFVGSAREDRQDGYYLQTLYGVLPRWRAGVRWEQVGLTNEADLPNGESESFDPSWKASAMVDFTPSEFSRFRVQVARGGYETEEGTEEATEVSLQAIFSIGAHGAHKF
ncbi:MAG: zinc-regulated TonB-dependent outer membrane receptor [Lentisphaerae bacterium]|nr:zinc-regulated TonB-dependent outer membrane receptor [Lentisphaerota bacterium]